MQDLRTLPGEYASLPLDVNDADQIVGSSIQDEEMTTPIAVVWQDGGITDLNKLVAPKQAGLFLVLA